MPESCRIYAAAFFAPLRSSKQEVFRGGHEIAVRVLKNFPAVKDDCEDFSRNIPASAGCRNSKNHMRVSNLMWFLLNNGRAYVDIEV